MNTITLIVWSIFAALVIASIIAYAAEQSARKLALKLLDTDAVDEKSALTLEELGFTGKDAAFVSFGASRGSRIGRAVGKVLPKDKVSAGEKDDLLFKTKPPVRYYLSDDAIDKSFKKHMSEHTPLWKLIGVFIILLAAALAATGVIRFLGRYASNVPGQFKQEVYGTEKDSDTLLEEQEKLMEEDIKAAEEAAKEAQEAAKMEAEDGEEADGKTDTEEAGQEDTEEITEEE